MDPNSIELENLSKSFKNIAKCYYKLYLKQQEVVAQLMSSSL